jgi:2-polyprenyl-3-methyl-5-hydroxy-6-metoxy-1,4-benzoquinol methylase
MNSKEIEKLIDYYISTQSNFPSIVISGLALFSSFIAIGVSYYTFRKQRDGSIAEYLSIIWNDVIDACMDNPQYLDISKTEHYFRVMENDEALKYEAYCYKVWGHVEDIVNLNKQDDEQFEPIISWVTTYHYMWLSRNPAFFNHEPFWIKVGEMRKQPQMVFGYRKLPTRNGDIDWDVVSEDYYSYILSPFAPEMVSTDDNGNSRNLILNYLNTIPKNDLAQMAVLDFGCGPGNLIPHINNKVNNLTGIDTSQGSIDIAKKVASDNNLINFEGICANILDISTDEKYDIIISSNSILPKTRTEVLDIYAKLRELLKPNGVILAILPSFDTTIYLRSLWEAHYKSLNIKDEQVNRITRAFASTKLMNEITYSYADDGHNIQSYHTKESIIDETNKAGLYLVTDPKKVHYPWDLTRRFDYGYFPSADEEIWDWFVIARCGEING